MKKTQTTNIYSVILLRAAAVLLAFTVLMLAFVLLSALLNNDGPGLTVIPVIMAVVLLCICFAVVMRSIRALKGIEKTIVDIKADLTLNGYLPDDIQYGPDKLLQEYKAFLEKEYSAKILTQQAELNSLQSQINPHFLYNTLEAIRGKALLDDSADTAEMAEALAILFRYSISRKGEMATLEEELQHLQKYIAIQQYRFKNKFILQTDIRGADTVLLNTLPRMTIQPIVENAVYHGLEMKIGQGRIKITVEETDQRVLITVSDDGVGIADDKLTQLNSLLSKDNISERISGEFGIAIINVNRRLKLCFGKEYGVKIYSVQGVGTDVELSIPNSKSIK